VGLSVGVVKGAEVGAPPLGHPPSHGYEE